MYAVMTELVQIDKTLGELRMDSVVHAAYALSYLKKLRTRIIGNLFLLSLIHIYQAQTPQQ